MKRLAIVGTGIAALGCAHQLQNQFEITLFEKNDYVGGHIHTVTVDEDGSKIPIDTGFMVFNEATYPNLTQLFHDLGVPTSATCMSFGVQHCPSKLEFAGTGWGGLFAQPKNLLRPSYWSFLGEINRFNTECQEVLNSSECQSMTLLEYLQSRGYTNDFRDKYLVPMSAAVWSSPPKAMLEFPAITLVRFFSNHRFLGLYGQLSWKTVTGGSHIYRDLLIRPFKDRIQINRPVVNVRRKENSVILTLCDGADEVYDAVILACHADEALRILSHPSNEEENLLSHFRYQKNIATLHTDSKIMPKNHRAWASWNYRVEPAGASTIYWMNRLQNVSKKKNYFVSINDPGSIDPNQVLKVIEYQHPLYTLEAIQAQKTLSRLNESSSIYFCGSYFRYGFHEDALTSGFEAASAILRRFH